MAYKVTYTDRHGNTQTADGGMHGEDADMLAADLATTTGHPAIVTHPGGSTRKVLGWKPGRK